MAERSREVRTKQVEYWCDECGRGVMRPMGVMLVQLSNPPRYEHRCPLCGAVANLSRQYPSIEYEYLEDANG